MDTEINMEFCAYKVGYNYSLFCLNQIPKIPPNSSLKIIFAFPFSNNMFPKAYYLLFCTKQRN